MTQTRPDLPGQSTAPGPAAVRALIPELTSICGPDAVITDPLELRTYECDGLTSHRCSPGLVVLPQAADQIAAIVRTCAHAGIPYNGTSNAITSTILLIPLSSSSVEPRRSCQPRRVQFNPNILDAKPGLVNSHPM